MTLGPQPPPCCVKLAPSFILYATLLQAIEGQGIKVYSFEEFAALGASKPAEPSPPSPDDYCTIMYTSGTTGDPKACTPCHLGQGGWG